MAACNTVAACDIDMDVCALKQQRAKSRDRQIATKRTEYQRARSVPRSRSSAPADRVKPHRIARTVTRSFVAKGLVQGDADMPSITSVGGSTSAHARKKPSVAGMVSCGADLFVESSDAPLNECSDAEVAAVLGKSCKKLNDRIPGLPPPAPKATRTVEPKLAIAEGIVQEQAKPDTKDQELKAGQVEEEKEEEDSNQECNVALVVDPGLDICALKMRRAEARKRHIAAKRVDYQRARSTPRARSSDPADRIKPHRIARAAARTFVAKGVVEGDSDMPHLTSMGKRASAHGRKKPSVAPLVQSGFTSGLEKSIFLLADSSDLETTASESEAVDKALLALRVEVSSDSDSGSEFKPTGDGGARELETPRSDEQDDFKQETEGKKKELPLHQGPAKNEAKVEREFVGRILDFELREADGVAEEAHGHAGPEPEEQGWEVLPGAESRLVNGRGAGKGWWNVFF